MVSYSRAFTLSTTLAATLGVFGCSDSVDPLACTEEGAPCVHPDACVTQAACMQGVCTPFQSVVCSGPAATCRALECQAGECVEVDAPDGAPCEDGDLCTVSDACFDGSCEAAPVECAAEDPCTLSACEPTTGLCVETPAEPGMACDDRDLCTNGERCIDGDCVPQREVICALSDCAISNVCDPNTGLCNETLAPDGTPCSDGNICNEGDACVSGVCLSGTPIDRGPVCEGPLCFTEVTAEVGLEYAVSTVSFIEGAGAATVDFDGNGWVDVLVFQERTQPGLFLNFDGRFVDATEGSGIENDFERLSIIQGVAAGDLDGDGDPDVVLVGEGANRLLENLGGGRFADRSQAAGIEDVPKWGVGVALGDYDLDSDLDILVGNYIRQPSAFPLHNPEGNRLFRNDGGLRFTDVTEEVGLDRGPHGTTLVVTFTDFDRDGLQDIVECNDFGQFVTPNRWLRARREASGRITYEDVASELGTDLAIYCMTNAKGDFDRDGDLDFYHTNIGRHVLLRNDGHRYQDVATELMVESTHEACVPSLKSSGWAAGFRDFDLDGWPDLFATAGFVPAAPEDRNAQESENKVFHREGDAFVDVSYASGVATTQRSRGASFFDFDRDGDVDVLVVNLNSPPELFRNDSPRRGRWLELDLIGTVSNPDGLGAKLWVDFGAFEIFEDLSLQYSYASSVEPRLHFGAGDAAAADVRIVWPSGIEQGLIGLETDALHAVREPRLSIDGLTREGSDVLVEFSGPGARGDAEISVDGATSAVVPTGAQRLPNVPAGAVILLSDGEGGVDARRAP